MAIKNLKTKVFGFFGHGRISRSGSLIFKIIASLGIGIGIGLLRYQSSTCQNEIKQTQALQIFMGIDDITHAQYAYMQIPGNSYGFTGFEEFLRIDNGFHSAETIQEKFKRAKEMDAFASNVEKWLRKVGAVKTAEDIEKDKKFLELHNLFIQLK